jgi:hypothetical protein
MAHTGVSPAPRGGARPSAASGGEAELDGDEVAAGDLFGDRVLHLDPRVGLDEGEPVGGYEELDGADVVVVEGGGEVDGGGQDPLAPLGSEGRRRRHLQRLLVAALDAAVALAEVGDGPRAVPRHLDLHVPGPREELLHIERRVAERR